jgi:hypothetical protein
MKNTSIDELAGNWLRLLVTEHQAPIEGYDGVCSWKVLENGNFADAFFVADSDNEAAADALDLMGETATEMGIACNAYASAWVHGTTSKSARIKPTELAKLATKVRKGTLHFRISKRGQFVLSKEAWSPRAKTARKVTGKKVSDFQARLAKLRGE